MSHSPAFAAPNLRVTPIVWGRVVGLVSLLIVEILAISIRYDTYALAGETHWAATVLDHARLLVHPGGTIVAATFLFGGKRFLQFLANAVDEPFTIRCSVLLLLQGVAYCLLFRATQYVLGGQFYALTHPTLAVSTWLIGCGITFALWFAALVRPVHWLPLATRFGNCFLLGMFIGIGAWQLGRWTDTFWTPLAHLTLRLVVVLLSWVEPHIRYSPTELRIGTPEFEVLVWPSCSGYQGIGLMWAFLLTYLWAFRHSLRFPQAFVLLPVGTIVIWLANVVRIVVLILIGTHYSPRVALGGFHSQAGPLAFVAIGMALIVASQRFAWFSKARASVIEQNPTGPFVLPLVTVLLTMMITRAMSDTFDVFYPLRVVTSFIVLWYFRASYLTLIRSELVGIRFANTPYHKQTAITRLLKELAPAILAGSGVFAMWMVLDITRDRMTSDASMSADPTHLAPLWARTWIILRTIGSVVTVPIVEELAFRGYLMRRLTSADYVALAYRQSSIMAILLSSAAFGALHGRWFAGTLAGIAYAFVTLRSGRLIDAIVAHALTNLLIAAYVISTSDWMLWG